MTFSIDEEVKVSLSAKYWGCNVYANGDVGADVGRRIDDPHRL